MNTPVETHPKTGVKSFTKQSVQRAMDAKAAAWGAPAGYYTVEDRGGVLTPLKQVWRVRVRLFGGSVHHLEDIVFKKDHKGDPVQYGQTYLHYLNRGGKVIDLFTPNARYANTSLEAAYRWEQGK